MLRQFGTHAVVALLFLIIGIVVQPYMYPNSTQRLDQFNKNGNYTYINPLLYCQDQNISGGLEKQLDTALKSYVQEQTSNGTFTNASVYFRDLNGGPWVLINGDVQSIPASLLKVPIAIAIYKHAEVNPGLLNSTITFAENPIANANQYYAPEKQLETGKRYTVEQMVEYMVRYSDNGALDALVKLLTPKELSDTFTDLGIDPPKAEGYVMTTRTYGSFLRVLYYATYLTPADSEKLLSLLAQSGFTAGLASGVPSSIPIAHKFGEFTVDQTHKQLHDCGVVYAPNHPYLLCVMTQGSDFPSLAKTIADISNIVYLNVTGKAK